MRELVKGKNTIGPEVIDPGGRSVEKPREVTLTLTYNTLVIRCFKSNKMIFKSISRRTCLCIKNAGRLLAIMLLV
jgi:hypothetical protein